MSAPDASGKVKIAVPTNGGVEIYRGILGISEMFFIYEVRGDGEVALIDRRRNCYGMFTEF